MATLVAIRKSNFDARLLPALIRIPAQSRFTRRCERVEQRLRTMDHLVGLAHPVVEAGEFELSPLDMRRHQRPRLDVGVGVRVVLNNG